MRTVASQSAGPSGGGSVLVCVLRDHGFDRFISALHGIAVGSICGRGSVSDAERL